MRTPSRKIKVKIKMRRHCTHTQLHHSEDLDAQPWLLQASLCVVCVLSCTFVHHIVLASAHKRTHMRTQEKDSGIYEYIYTYTYIY